MKKLLSMFLLVLMLVALVACSDDSATPQFLVDSKLDAITVKEFEGRKIDAEVARGLYSGNSGSFTAHSGYKSIKFKYDGKSRINATTYVLENAVTIACFYDSSDTFIGSTGLETETKWIKDYPLSIPKNTAYIALNCRYTGVEMPEAYIVTEENVYCDYSKILHGKKIVNFGDSIFGSYRDANPSDKSISSFIEEMTGANVYNAGFGNCRMATHDEYWNAFSMNSLANAIASGDWTAQEIAIRMQPDLPDYFSETLAMLKGMNWNDIDTITIGYGTNDYKGNVLLEEFKASLEYSLETIMRAYPHLQIVVVGPMWRCFMVDGTYSYCSDDEASKNANGDLLTDYVKVCEDVSREYHVPYLDTYYTMGINRYNYSWYFGAEDGTHPNYNGRELRAKYIANKLISILGI